MQIQNLVLNVVNVFYEGSRSTLSVSHLGQVNLACFYLGRDKRICVFEHSVMINFNCACPAIQRARDLAFCLKVPLDSLLV